MPNARMLALCRCMYACTYVSHAFVLLLLAFLRAQPLAGVLLAITLDTFAYSWMCVACSAGSCLAFLELQIIRP
jgi:hypothetical protein